MYQPLVLVLISSHSTSFAALQVASLGGHEYGRHRLLRHGADSVKAQYQCCCPLTSTGPCRFVLGEGIEKKTNDLAKEVEAQTKAFEEAAAKKAAAAPESAEPAPEAAAEPSQVL